MHFRPFLKAFFCALAATCCTNAIAQSDFTASEAPSPGAITVTWQSAAADVSQYEIWRGVNDQLASAASIATNAPATTVFVDDTALFNVTYFYWVRAVASSGSEEWLGPAAASQTSKRWEQSVGSVQDAITSAPAVSAEGMCVVASYMRGTSPRNGKVTAFDKEGAIAWQYTEPTDGFTTPPAIAPDGTVFAQALGYLYAFSKSGELLWTKRVGVFAPRLVGQLGPALTFDNLVVFHGTNGITAVDFAGNEKWVYPLRSTIDGAHYAFSPVIGSDGTIYVSTAAGLTNAVIALNPDGTLRWTGPDFCTVYSPLAVDPYQNLTTFGSDSRGLEQFGPDGTLKRAGSGFCAGAELIRPNGDVVYTSPPQVRTISVSGIDQPLVSDTLNISEGSLAIAENGTVLVGFMTPTLGPILARIDGSTMTNIGWGHGLASPITLTTNGDIVFGTAQGRVYCFKSDLRPPTRGWPMQRFDQAQTGRQQAAPKLTPSFANGYKIQITMPTATEAQIEKSSDLVNWTPDQRASLTNGSAEVAVDVTNGPVFFRATVPSP